jgi:hypothetical protein
VRTLTLLRNVVARGSGLWGSGSRKILPSSLFGSAQSELFAGGRFTFSQEPVTFPHTITLRLWLGFSVSNTASTSSGTHCSGVGMLNLWESGRQFSNGIRTAEVCVRKSEATSNITASGRNTGGIVGLGDIVQLFW